MGMSIHNTFSNWRHTQNIKDPPMQIVIIIMMTTEAISTELAVAEAVKKMKMVMLHWASQMKVIVNPLRASFHCSGDTNNIWQVHQKYVESSTEGLTGMSNSKRGIQYINGYSGFYYWGGIWYIGHRWEQDICQEVSGWEWCQGPNICTYGLWSWIQPKLYI